MLVSVSAHADVFGDPADWTASNDVMEVTFLALMAADAATTEDIKNYPGYYETNPILGRHPGDDRIVAYFASTAFLEWTVARALPVEYRGIFQASAIGLEIYSVGNNMTIYGLKVKF